MKDNGKAVVFASFAADSLALGPHWIYDVHKIEASFGRVDALAAPGADSFHKTKKKGDFTHYGDQTWVLLRSVADKKMFDPHDFSEKWQNLFQNYTGYVDKATRATLANLEKGIEPEAAGSSSNDLAGAARIAPLVLPYVDDLDSWVAAARSQTAMTHNHEAVIDAAAFFATVIHSVLNGAAPGDAIRHAAEREAFAMSPISMYIGPGLRSRSEESIAVIRRFGQACEINQAFPGTIHLIARYEDNLKEALVQSVMAGGDSAARGSLVAMVLAAHSGMESIPEAWLEGINRMDEIRSLVDRII